MMPAALLKRIPRKVWEEWLRMWNGEIMEDYDDNDNLYQYHISDEFCNKYWNLSRNILGESSSKKGCHACPLDVVRQAGQIQYTCQWILKDIDGHFSGEMDVEKIDWYADEYGYEDVVDEVAGIASWMISHIENMGCHCDFEL